MPSASSKPENKSSLEVETPIKQAIGAVERKVRNLEKRKGKLDGYKEKLQSGATLNADQKEALDKYDLVVQSLDFAREMQKQFISISVDAEKLLKKQAKREKNEQQKIELKRFQELLELQAVLDHMGSEDVREDFLNGKNGAVTLTEENLDDLDKLYKLISPSREEADDKSYGEQLKDASEHIVSFLDSKEKQVIGSTTYKMLKNLVLRINQCGYFDPKSKEEKEEESRQESTTEDEDIPTAIQLSSETDLKNDYFNAPEKDDSPVTTQNTEQYEILGAEKSEGTPGIPQEYVPVNNVTHPSNMVDDSFFSTSRQFQQQRPLNEIVDSVQGSFNFLQDSEIDLESPHMDPAVVAAHPMAPSAVGIPQTSDANLVQSYQSTGHLGEEHQAQHPNQQIDQESQQTTQQSLTSIGSGLDPTATVFVSKQNVLDPTFTSQGYSNIVSQTATGQQYSTDPSLGLGPQTAPSYTALGGISSLGSEPTDVPPAIPMPNETATLKNQQISANDQNSQEKKFTMNADAAVFKSMYSQPTFPDQQQVDDRGFEQDGEFQGSGVNQSGGYSRSRGGSKGGRGGNRGGSMSNGYRGRGGNYGGNRGNYNNRGNRGSYQGYSSRSDYRPEGYQGSNNGFGGGFGTKRGGGGMRGATRGAPRGGSQRGRGGFGRPSSGQQQ